MSHMAVFKTRRARDTFSFESSLHVLEDLVISWTSEDVLGDVVISVSAILFKYILCSAICR